MKSYEPGSFLKEKDYKKPSRRTLTVIAGLCILALIVFIVPLLN